jgi:DNA-binding transcriptional LysR family regulator
MGGQLSIAIFDKTASNPACKISQAIALFSERAPEVGLELHVAPLNTIERGVIDGQYQIGVIPTHRPSESLVYHELFDETMLLYCAPGHPWHAGRGKPGWAELRGANFAGLGYHSPNMALAHDYRIARRATGFDQESIATLILSGRYVGFLPDHYAESFVRTARLRAVNPAELTYATHFAAILRRSPQASRATRVFVDCLNEAHA